MIDSHIICRYTHMHTRRHTQKHTHTLIFTHTHTHTYTHVPMHAHKQASQVEKHIHTKKLSGTQTQPAMHCL